jgi:CheY-like chemotaxis protein
MISYHIIIADDSDTVRGLVARVVAHTYPAVRISAVADGQAALDIFQQEGADLLITNNDMPRLGGIALAQQVRASGATLPIVMLSGNAAVAPAAQAAGVTSFVSKPFTIEQLTHVLTQLLPA